MADLLYLPDEDDIARIEAESNEVIDQDLAVRKASRERAAVEAEVPDGRTQLNQIPDHVDPLLVVSIDGFDTCPCGGTHVERLQFELVDSTGAN